MLHVMTFRDWAESYATRARDCELEAAGFPPTSRDYMARMNAAKTCAQISQAFSALHATATPTPRVVKL